MKGKFLFLILILTSSFNFSQILYWQNIGRFENAVDFEFVDEKFLFVSQEGDYSNPDGLFYSESFGNYWKRLSNLPINFKPGKIIYNQINQVLFCFDTEDISLCRSYNLGITWAKKLTGIPGAKYVKINSSGYIIIGEENGGLAYSVDNGQNWTLFPRPDLRISDMAVDIYDNIYISTNTGVFKTSNYGNDWLRICDFEFTRSISIDSSNNIFIISNSNVYVSTDTGINWINLNFTGLGSPRQVETDDDANVYVSTGFFNGLYKKENSGDWFKIGLADVRNFKVESLEKIFAISIDVRSNEIFFVYDSSAIPNFGKNYLPLTVDNIWEQMCVTSSSPDPIWNYRLKYLHVQKDTLINSNKYYKVTGFSDNWIRYDDSLKTISIFADGNDNVYIDFTKFDGEKYFSYSPYYPISNEVEAISSTEQFLGEEIDCKGILVRDFTSSNSILFAENYGFFIKEGSGSGGGGISSYQDKTIQLILSDTLGNTINYPHFHYPEFIITPLSVIGNTYFRLDFEVDHEYTRFGYYLYMPDGGVNYIDMVLLEYFYQKGNDSTQLDSIYASNTQLTRDYTIQINLDSTLLNSGYELKYKLTATEIGILPKSTTVPETGWYTCIYDNTVSVEDEVNEFPKQFSLAQNYPNPFNPTTTINYFIAEETFVNISVYDVLGRKVAVLVNENKSPGEYQVEYNAEKYNSGIYFYQIDARKYKEVKKMLLLK